MLDLNLLNLFGIDPETLANRKAEDAATRSGADKAADEKEKTTTRALNFLRTGQKAVHDKLDELIAKAERIEGARLYIPLGVFGNNAPKLPDPFDLVTAMRAARSLLASEQLRGFAVLMFAKYLAELATEGLKTYDPDSAEGRKNIRVSVDAGATASPLVTVGSFKDFTASGTIALAMIFPEPVALAVVDYIDRSAKC